MNADLLGLSELDTLNKEVDLYTEANAIGKKAHLELVDFLVNEMGYEPYIYEKGNGLYASAIFYKRDKFECLEKGKLGLDFKSDGSGKIDEVGNEKQDSDSGLIYLRLAPKEHGTGKVDMDKQFVFGETHLKGMDENRAIRVAQINKIMDHYDEKF